MGTTRYATEKPCRRCKITKPLEAFYLRKNGYRISVCQECKSSPEELMQRRDYYRKRVAEDPMYVRRSSLRSRYGITVERYEEMAAEQDGKCLLCQRKKTLVVDHCHVHGHVRGLLCASCNYFLGVLEDDAWVARAREYLSRAPDSSRGLFQKRGIQVGG